MLFYLKTALDKLSLTNKSSNGDKQNTAEYVWFMKIGESKVHCDVYRSLVSTARQLSPSISRILTILGNVY